MRSFPKSSIAPSCTRMLVLSLACLAFVASALPAAAASGPDLVKDINTSGSSAPAELTALGETLYFSARGVKGRELWRSDGTLTGTIRVKDIKPGSGGSNPVGLTAIGALLYFAADDGVHGREPWVSDGTGAGTRMIKDIRPGSDGSDPGWFAEFNGSVYFAADDGTTGSELWRTDGSAAGTGRVKDINPGASSSRPAQLVVFAGKLFFVRSNDVPVNGTDTLYKTDGTARGTKPFRDAGGSIVRGSCICGMIVIGSRLLFDYGEVAVWRTNGTAATTKKLADVGVGEGFAAVGAVAYFDAYPGQLWKSDGTKAGTVLVKEIGDGSQVSGLTSVDGQLLFFTHSEGLWRSNGTNGGTQLFAQVLSQDPPAAIGSVMYFAGYTVAEWEEWPYPSEPPQTIWRSDGTVDGTHSVGDPAADMSDLVAVGSALFFVSNAGGHGRELWRYVP